jgi:HSP90 family molecular chaperone
VCQSGVRICKQLCHACLHHTTGAVIKDTPAADTVPLAAVQVCYCLQYKSSKSGDVLTGLADYVSRMKEGQKNIFYIATESDELAANSPFVEALEKKGVEVLYFTEPIDEWCASQLAEFDDKKLVDVTKEGIDIDEEDKAKVEKAEKKLKVLCHCRTLCRNAGLFPVKLWLQLDHRAAVLICRRRVACRLWWSSCSQS